MAKIKRRVATRRASNRNVWIIAILFAALGVAAFVWWFTSNSSAADSAVLATLNTRDYHALAFHSPNYGLATIPMFFSLGIMVA